MKLNITFKRILGVMMITAACVGAGKAFASQSDGTEFGGQTQAWGCNFSGSSSDVCDFTTSTTIYHVVNCKTGTPIASNCSF